MFLVVHWLSRLLSCVRSYMVLITTVCEINWQAFTLFETTSGWIYRNSYAVGSQVLFLFFDDFEGRFEGNSHMHLAAAPKGT